MSSFIDQIGNTIQVSIPAKRIVSLVPSQTELLYSLGLNEEVVGITKFCIHPREWFKTKQRVGGTKNVKIRAVESLQPDLIIANKEENVQEQIKELRKIAPVWVSNIQTLAQAVDMIQSIGTLVGKTNMASKMASDITNGFLQIAPLTNRPRTAYLIWKDPYMAAGGDTFINDIMCYCGFDNVFKNHPRYPTVALNELSRLNCELLLLSSEPYPFKRKHIQEIQQKITNTKIVLVDGEMFSWYGSRLCLVRSYLTAFIAEVQEKL